MPILEKTIRIGAIVLAVLFVGLRLCCRHEMAWPRRAFPNPPMTATLSEREEYF